MSRWWRPLTLDLLDRGVDLAEWLARNRWRTLLTIIDGLPPTSRYVDAVLSDPEQVEVLAQSQLDAAADMDEWSPRLSEWPLELEILAGIWEQLAARNAREGSRPPRFPRPPNPVAERVKEIRDTRRAAFTDDLLAGRVKITL